MKPHRKQDRIPPLLDRDGELYVRAQSGRRRNPQRYAHTGFYTDYWDKDLRTWRTARYFRDWDSMIRSRDREEWNSWSPRTIRVRYPGDGKENIPPTTPCFEKIHTAPISPDPPEPVSRKFLDRVSVGISRGVRIRLVYLDRNEIKTVRTVLPLRWGKGDHFIAFCELRSAEREFCVHRILDCQFTEE